MTNLLLITNFVGALIIFFLNYQEIFPLFILLLSTIHFFIFNIYKKSSFLVYLIFISNIVFQLLIIFCSNIFRFNWIINIPNLTKDSIWYFQFANLNESIFTLKSGSIFSKFLILLNAESLTNLGTPVVLINSILMLLITLIFIKIYKLFNANQINYKVYNFLIISVLTNPTLIYFSNFAVKEIFVIFILSNTFLCISLFEKSKKYKNVWLLLALIFFILACLDRSPFFIILSISIFINLIYSIARLKFNKKFLSLGLLLIIPSSVLLVFFKNKGFNYVSEVLLKHTNLSLISIFDSFLLTPFPLSFYTFNVDFFPNTIDQMLSLVLPFNLIILFFYIKNILNSNFKNLSFTAISLNTWIISAIIFYSIYFGNLLRMKLSYLAFLPLAIILLQLNNKIKDKLDV